jgi:predicted phage terminase large subunit-like protein
VSATADLAEKQLKFIKDILLSDIYRHYWPEMVNLNENLRERWAVNEISVDHPKRKAEGIRDPSVKAVGITANITGFHCNIAVLDDLVVPANAYTELGREQTKALYSQLASIETTGSKEWAVGTRYHPGDIYRDMVDMVEILEEGGQDVEKPVYEIFSRQVETHGEFLWPKMRRHDGKMFGFDEKELARKKAKYLDVTQFHAQYYNNPNATTDGAVDAQLFQYYNREALMNRSGVWYLGEKLLNVYAAIDFSYTVSKTADYTVIMVVGADEDGFIYILEIDRFRTRSIREMYEHAERLHRKWHFLRLRAEVTAAQQLVVNQMKDYMRMVNLPLAVDEHRPVKNKEERIHAALAPRYENKMIWHYKGGNCQSLEEELRMQHPEHDDCKDALAAVVETAYGPAKSRRRAASTNVIFNSRFGGVAYNQR